MQFWFYPQNESLFLFEKALSAGSGTVDIHDSYGFSVGDKVYVFQSSPVNSIKLEMEVVDTNIHFENSNDEERFWKDQDSFYTNLYRTPYSRLKLTRELNNPELTAENLKAHGLKSLISVDVLSEDTLAYILSPAIDDTYGVDYPEDNDFYEGALLTIEVNKYERSRSARDKCIALKGCRCAVCGIDFGEKYGPTGKGFIHVHHLVPISSIGKEYKLDPERDLVPVCPNCHYMLHRKPEGVYSIEELREMLNNDGFTT